LLLALTITSASSGTPTHPSPRTCRKDVKGSRAPSHTQRAVRTITGVRQTYPAIGRLAAHGTALAVGEQPMHI